MSTPQQLEEFRQKLQGAFDRLVDKLAEIQIGDRDIYPFGWRKAAKGRTVWRLIEEAIVQNLELDPAQLGLKSVTPAESEVGVYDLAVELPDTDGVAYINIKSAVLGGRKNKDDISKAVGLLNFFNETPDAPLFIATVELDFSDDMAVVLNKAYVMPTAWLPDVYVNPSNNGNLQSSKYKDLESAIKRSTAEFVDELTAQTEIAAEKRRKKTSR